ncbi:uncharacterized transporter B0285.6-like [Ixodes scapularis]|uniref:uncharacterized transporter B0285.6-like n=1 Tax=Ixodes scapularis TaxID=6945 RepID=UPI001C38DD3A|nr:uncharacterized transporter B0285.6-like [Ixodes scapularis]
MITYSKWITTNIVGAAVNVIALWVFLVHFYVRKLWQEAMTIACYGITLLGMYFRAPPFMQGWPEYVGVKEWIGEPTPLLFAIFFVVTFLSGAPLSHVEAAALWNQAEAAIPWSTLLVMGAGFALNSAIKKTELVALLMSGTTARLGLSAISLQITLSAAVSLLAELRGGVALCALVLPVVVKLSDYSHAILGLFTHIVYVTTAVSVTNTVAVPVFNMTQIPRRKYDFI